MDSPLQKYNSLLNNPKLREQARQMYYSGLFHTDIAENLNIDVMELGRYVFGDDCTGKSPSCWAYKRLNRPASSVQTYVAVKPLILKHTESRLMNRIRLSLDSIEQQKTLFDLDGIDTASKIVERIDRITRLEEGKATTNIAIEKKSYTLREISDLNRTRTAEAVDVTDRSGSSDVGIRDMVPHVPISDGVVSGLTPTEVPPSIAGPDEDGWEAIIRGVANGK